MENSIKDKVTMSYKEKYRTIYGNPHLNEVNDLIKINEVIRKQLPNDTKFLLTKRDLSMFHSFIIKTTVEDLVQLNELIRSSYLYSNQSIINKEDKLVLSKQIIIALTYVFYRSSKTVSILTETFELLFGLARKMRVSGLIEGEHIIFIFKMGYIFSIHDYNTTKQMPHYTLIYTIIHQLIMISREAMKDIDIEGILGPLLEFLIQSIKVNRNLLTLLRNQGDSIKTLKLLQYSQIKPSTRLKVFSLLSMIYVGSYNEKVFREYIMMVKEALFHYNNLKETKEDINLMIGQMDLVREMIDEERRAKRDDPYQCNNGFIFNDHPEKGFSIMLLQVKDKNKPTSMVFSFQPTELIPDVEYPLISLCSLDIKLKEYFLRISIKSDELILVSKSRTRIAYDFKINRTYLVTLQWKTKNIMFSSVVDLNIIINQQKVTSKGNKNDELSLKLDENLKVIIAPKADNNEKDFIGRINPMMIFKKRMDKGHINTLFELMGDYSEILNSCISSDMSQYDQYTPVKIKEKVKNPKDIDDLIKFINEYCLLVISPISVLRKLNKRTKLYFKEVIYDFRKTKEKKPLFYEFTICPLIENFATYPYQYNSTIREFLKYEGMSLVCLYLEYFYNILFQKIHKEVQIEIMKGITRTIRLVVFYLDLSQVSFEALNNQCSTYLFSLAKAVSLLSEYNVNLSQELGEGLIELFNSLLTIRKKNGSMREIRENTCKMFIFLLQPKFFDLSDNSRLKKLFQLLSTFLEDFTEGGKLITSQTLNLILQFHIVLSGSYLHEKYFVPNKISIHHISLSSYKEYKNMKQEYESLLGTFISKGNINILNDVIKFISDPLPLMIRYKLFKVYFFSVNKNMKELEDKKKKSALIKQYNELFKLYSSSEHQTEISPKEEKYKNLIKSILLQLIIEFKEKKKKDKDKSLYDSIKEIKSSIIQESNYLIREKSNISVSPLKKMNSDYFSNTLLSPDAKKAQETVLLPQLKNIVFNEKTSFYEIKSIFLVNYDSWDPKAKIYFITEDKPIPNNDLLEYYSTYNLLVDVFDKQKKNILIYIIHLLYKIYIEDDLTATKTVLLFCNYIYQVYKAYSRSVQPIQEKKIKCQFIHLFESRSIMCPFFTICFESYDTFEYAKIILKEIIPDLVWKHPDPFIFKFTYSHMKKSPDEIVFVMKHIAVTLLTHITNISEKKEALIPLDSGINIIRFLIILYKLILLNKISKELLEQENLCESLLKLLKAFKEKSLYIYSKKLIQVSKKRKMFKTINHIYYKTLFKIFEIIEIDLNITYLQDFISIENKYSLFYYIDVRMLKTSEMKINKHKQIEDEFNSIKEKIKKNFNSKVSETRLSVLEFYIDMVHFLKRLKGVKIENKFDLLTNTLRDEVLDGLNLLGSNVIVKEDNSLYSQALIKIHKFPTYNMQKNYLKDIFFSIDNLIIEAHPESIELSNEYESTDIIDKPQSSKPLDRKDSFTLCNNKCKEGENKKSPQNLITISTSEEGLDYHTFQDLNLDNPILCMKRDLLLKPFGVYFNDIYFSNPNFDQLKRAYHTLYNRDDPNNSYYSQNDKQQLKFPSKLKNFSSCENFYPKMFLKQDLNFFRKSNRFFRICFKNFNRKDFKYKLFKVKHGLINNKNIKNLFNNDVNNSGNDFVEFPCERITNEMVYFGHLYLTKYYILFQSDKDFKVMDEYKANRQYLISSQEYDIEQTTKQIIIQLNKVNELFSRRFIYNLQAIEISLHNGKSYFFNLFSIKKLNEFIKKVQGFNENISIIRNPKDTFLTERNFREQWKNDQLTTFDYLLQINKYSGRTYNDINQYPIMPWVLLYIKDKPEERNLKLPISVQSEKEQMRAIDRFNNPMSKKHPFHFGVHFSNSAFVNSYLVRMLPFTYNQIKFQNNKFDFPDRQFVSYDKMVFSLTNNLDNRELIPELFLIPEFAFNLNYIEFGKKVIDKTNVNNLQCPIAADSPLRLSLLIKSTLNGKTVKDSINQWIDSIFGINQKRIQKGCFIYQKHTYEQYIIPKLEAIQKDYDSNQGKLFEKVRNLINLIMPLGQFPAQLFDNSHLQMKKQLTFNRTKTDFFEPFSNDINNNTFSSLKKTKHKVINNNSRSNAILCLTMHEDNEVIRIFDINLNERSIRLFGDMTFLETINGYRIYKLKYGIIGYTGRNIIIACRFYDNTIKVKLIKKGEEYSVLTESFVSCIKEIDDWSFYSGHQNGKLILWTIMYEGDQFKSLIPKTSIIAHQGRINAIEINVKHDIVITAGDDNQIFIRKKYDFELLSVIGLNDHSKAVDIQMSNSLDVIYAKVYDSTLNKFHIKLYTINGLIFEETAPVEWLDFIISKNNNVIYIDSKEKKLLSLTGDLKQTGIIKSFSRVPAEIFNSEKFNNLFYSRSIEFVDTISIEQK